MQILKRRIGEVVDIILPPRCVVTGEPVEQQGMVSPEAWAGLDFITDPHCDVCGIPFEFEAKGDSVCVSCLTEPPPYETARSAFRYNDTSRNLILGFKHADKLHVVKSFSPWLSRAGEKILAKADYLVPVPLHYWRLVSRRFSCSRPHIGSGRKAWL